MFYVYILYSMSVDKFYIGQTNDLDKRIIRHNRGYVKSTKSYKPWKLVHFESYNTRSEAVKRELEIKRWKSSKRIIELVDASR